MALVNNSYGQLVSQFSVRSKDTEFEEIVREKMKGTRFVPDGKTPLYSEFFIDAVKRYPGETQGSGAGDMERIGLSGVIFDPLAHDWDAELKKPVLHLIVDDLLHFMMQRGNAKILQWRAYQPGFRTKLVTNHGVEHDHILISSANRAALERLLHYYPGMDFDEQMARRFSVRLHRTLYPFFLLNDDICVAQFYQSPDQSPHFALQFKADVPNGLGRQWRKHFDAHFDHVIQEGELPLFNDFRKWMSGYFWEGDPE